MGFLQKDRKNRSNVRRLIGAASVEDCCLSNYSKEKAAFLIIAPVNLNVLSPSVIESLVDSLSKSIVEIGTVEILCINSAQSYESNKHFLSQCMLREKNDTLKMLDKQDTDFLDDIQVRMATSREFLLALRFASNISLSQVSATLERARQITTQNGFHVQSADKSAIKRLLAIYFEQNIYEDEMQDFDGERFSPILEMKK